MGLFRGNALTLMKTFFNSFYSRHLKQTFSASFIDRERSSNSLATICSNYFYILSFSSLVQHVLVYPVDRLRTVIMTDYSKFVDRKSTFNTRYIGDVIRIESMGKLYKGFGFSLLTTIPDNIVILAAFGGLQRNFGLGVTDAVFLSSFIATTILYPLDTVLKRYQADSLLKKRKYMYQSIKHLISEINRQEGVRGYYKGFLTATLTNSLSTVLYIALFRSMYSSQVVLH